VFLRVIVSFIRWGKSKRRRRKRVRCVVCCGDLLSLSCEFNFFFPREVEREVFFREKKIRKNKISKKKKQEKNGRNFYKTKDMR
jgi:hypothetical protein